MPRGQLLLRPRVQHGAPGRQAEAEDNEGHGWRWEVGREWTEAGTGRRVHMGPGPCSCCPIGTVEEAPVGAALIGGCGGDRKLQRPSGVPKPAGRQGQSALFPLTQHPGPRAAGLQPPASRPWICGTVLFHWPGAGQAGSTKGHASEVTGIVRRCSQTWVWGLSPGSQSGLPLAPGCPWPQFPHR